MEDYLELIRNFFHFPTENVEMERYGNLAEHSRTNGLAALPLK